MENILRNVSGSSLGTWESNGNSQDGEGTITYAGSSWPIN